MKEVKRTMKSMSIMEKENAEKLNFMVPMSIVGRHQIMVKLKDLIVDVNEVIVKPINEIPCVIRKVKAFFSPDGYCSGNFIAYGTDLYGKDILLWDDVLIDEIPHYATMVETSYVKKHMDSEKPVTLIVCKENSKGKYALEMYCYLP